MARGGFMWGWNADQSDSEVRSGHTLVSVGYLQILASSEKFIFIQHFERNEKQVSSHSMFFIQLLNGSQPAGEISTQIKPNTKDIDCDYTKDVIAKSFQFYVFAVMALHTLVSNHQRLCHLLSVFLVFVCGHVLLAPQPYKTQSWNLTVKFKDGCGFERGGWKQKSGTPFFTALADIHGPWDTTEAVLRTLLCVSYLSLSVFVCGLILSTHYHQNHVRCSYVTLLTL